MAADDEDKTASHTSQGIYCYTKMPFGLKNAGATYQRVIDKAFKGQIGRNLEAYVDDLVIKSITEQGLLEDILETFASLRKINMKLNPSKCSFGEEEGKFLGHIITERGIRANPKKIEAIENMPSPRYKKEVQSLTGKLAALTRGGRIGISGNEKVVKRVANNDRADCGRNIDTILSSIKRSNKFSIDSKQGTGSELNYPAIEKLVYALVHTARRLRRYFQAHPIMVLTDQPIKQVLYKPENSGRMAKWAIELSEHEISFSPRSAVKGCNQFNGIFEAHDESMQKYLKLVQELAVDFDLFQITQVSRTLNKKAEALSKLAALTFSHFKKEIWVEEVKVKSIDTDGISAAVEEEEQSWMTPIVEFLNKGALPMDSTEARKIKMKTPMYLLDKGFLYRKSFLEPHLRCLNPTQAESIIREVHEGMCALHLGYKIVASKIMRLGYYWPLMYRDAAEFEGNAFSDWCQELNIKQTFTSVAHPQANGQCEVTNWDIVLGIKARLGLCRRGWIDELPNNEASTAEDTGKLGPKWEGSYKVIGVSDIGAYRLASLDGKAIKRTWHAQTLKQCYI
ncbi:uncharacterized protein [Rutidosis leptorrhynchoides]|uniref:uncharacterized protein n=1 Tax=Rutidosis leptorrhynchoides TaxID=125765 RepID=UPI003A98F3E7